VQRNAGNYVAHADDSAAIAGGGVQPCPLQNCPPQPDCTGGGGGGVRQALELSDDVGGGGGGRTLLQDIDLNDPTNPFIAPLFGGSRLVRTDA